MVGLVRSLRTPFAQISPRTSIKAMFCDSVGKNDTEVASKLYDAFKSYEIITC